MDINIEEFRIFLEDNLEEEIIFMNYGNSFGFKADLFLLEFSIQRDTFSIKNFEVDENYRRKGFGIEILNLIKTYINENTRFDIKIEDMKSDPGVEEFWKVVGF